MCMMVEPGRVTLILNNKETDHRHIDVWMSVSASLTNMNIDHNEKGQHGTAWRKPDTMCFYEWQLQMRAKNSTEQKTTSAQCGEH